MTVLSITSVVPICSETMFRSAYPTKVAKGRLKSFENKTQAKNKFCILRFCPTFSMLEV